MSLIEPLRKAVSIDSSIKRGTHEVAQFFSQFAIENGLCAEIIEENYLGRIQGVLLITYGKLNPDTQLASFVPIETENPGHMALWSKTQMNPFILSIEDNQIYGLGVQRKASFIAQIKALAESKNTNVVLVGTFGAESGEACLRLIRKKIINPKVAVVHGPTDLGVANKGAGFSRLEIKMAFSEEEKSAREQLESSDGAVTQSKIFNSGSSETIDYFENPVCKMLNYFRNLPDSVLLVAAEGGSSDTTWPDSVWLELDVGSSVQTSIGQKLIELNDVLKYAASFRKLTAEGFVPNHSTFNIGRVRTYQDGIKMAGSCRLVPSQEKAVYKEWLNQLKDDAKAIDAVVDVLSFREPFQLDANDEWLQFILKNTGYTLSKRAPECTAANLLSRFNIKSVVYGLGNTKDLGIVVNESVACDKFEDSIVCYEKLFKVCAQ